MNTTSDPPMASIDNAVLVWTWQRGGNAKVVRLDGLHLEVHSSAPYPPGAPLVAESKQGSRFEVKVRGCRKLPSGEFAITGSLVNLTRDLREQLATALAEPAQPSS